MSNNNEDIDQHLMTHNYDGIQELDNPMPDWWLVTFFITIIFAGLYYIHFEISGLTNSDKELAQELAKIEAMRNKVSEDKPKDVDINAYLTDSGALSEGKKHYMSRCAVCHGNEGQGGIGPNLADNFWKNSKGSYEEIIGLVEEGVTTMGMPAWKNLMKHDQIVKTAAFVKNLQGTNPPNPKAPEGDEVK